MDKTIIKKLKGLAYADESDCCYNSKWSHVIRNDKVGVLKEGNVADLIILNQNPPENIENIRTIDLVLHDGKIVRE